jgi:putative ABC transport system permease protein
MNTEQVLDEFRAAGALREGHFVLSSGLHSGVFLQKNLVFQSPDRTERLCRALAEKIRAAVGEVDICVSPAVGGIIPGYETARHLGVPSVYVEREGGEFRLRRAFEIPAGARVAMVDPAPGSVTLPSDFPETARRALEAPMTVVVDASALKKLGVAVGDSVILRGQTLQVAATVKGYANIEVPTVFVSRDTLIRLRLMTSGDRSGLLLLKLKHPERAAEVRDFLNTKANGEYRAWLPEDLSRANAADFMKEQVVGVLLGFSLVLALLIGVGITSQTLRGAVASNIREFASLRALGVSMGALRGVVVELAFWVGIAGLLGTALLMGCVLAAARLNNIAMSLPPAYVGEVAVLLMAIALVSGFLSLGALSRSQPAELLR